MGNIKKDAEKVRSRLIQKNKRILTEMLKDEEMSKALENFKNELGETGFNVEVNINAGILVSSMRIKLTKIKKGIVSWFVFKKPTEVIMEKYLGTKRDVVLIGSHYQNNQDKGIIPKIIKDKFVPLLKETEDEYHSYKCPIKRGCSIENCDGTFSGIERCSK